MWQKEKQMIEINSDWSGHQKGKKPHGLNVVSAKQI